MRRIIFKILTAFVLILGVVYAVLLVLAQKSPGVGDRDWAERIEAEGWSKVIEAGGSRLHYIEAGRGPAVLLIHGYADSSYSWHRNIAVLARAGFRVLALDLPGFGESSIPDGFVFTPESMAGVVISFLDAKGLDKVHVVGNSLGGNLTLYLAGRYPGRVGRIVPVDPACYRSNVHGMASAAAGSKVLAALVRPLIGPWAFEIGLRRAYHDPALAPEALVSQKSLPFLRPEYTNTLIRVGAEYFGEAFLEQSRNYGRIKAPTLLIWGSTDRLVVTEQNAERLHKDMPGSKLVIIPKSGHLPHQETPETFNKLVIDFLRAGS